MRLFIAIPASEPTKVAVRALIEDLSVDCPGVRWVLDQNMHITLAFLGRTDEEQVPAIADSLQNVAARNASFTVRLQGVGAFPDTAEPVTLWAGLTRGLGQLETLQHSVAEAMLANGYEPETRPYRPHLTIGRVRDPESASAVGEAIDMLKSRPIGELPVSELVLYASDLTPDGPRYERIGVRVEFNRVS